MKTSQTSKQLTPKRPVQHTEVGPSERKKKESGQELRVRLLVLLLGSLAIVFVLHMIVVYAQSPNAQPTTCDQLITTANYPQVVKLQPEGQEMAAVQMVNSLDNGAPAALVQVTNNATPPTLDVYIFGCTAQQSQPRLTQLFSQQGLVHGSVTLTPQHTLLIENLDTKILPSAIPFLQPLQQNIYHEYTWRQGTFVQMNYAGFYPVSSRSEAAELQQSANDGQVVPWNDPVSTALQMSKDLLQWSPDPQAQLVSHVADTAVVQLTKQSPHVVLVVTLKQLLQNNATGLWFVTDARTKGMIVTRAGTLNQALPSPQSSPLQFSGANALIDGQTNATLFDHTMTPISQATNVPLTVRSDSSFSGSLAYTNVLSGQQGILLISSMPKTNNLNKESGQMLLTGIILN
ncbi:MAG TPA: hypothetical protein VGM01_10460 [Ktedonobacteraceae bacterium]|jgi:hypothetical protein